MTNRPRLQAALLLIFGPSLAASACTTAEQADVILTNGHVVTVDSLQPEAEAIAIVDDRILAVGDNSAIDAHRGPDTDVIDLDGATVVPGLVDAHLHFPNLGADRSRLVELDDARSMQEAVALVERRVRDLPPGEWLTGSGWHTGNWEIEAWPTAAALDRVAPDNPVALVGMHSHASWLNSKAMQAAGITADRPDPADGVIQRDPVTGEPTGVLIENAQWIVREVIPPQQTESLKERIRKSVQLALSYGFTGTHDIGTSLEAVEAYRELIAGGEFPFRVNGVIRIWQPGEILDTLTAMGPIIAEGDHRLTVRSVKMSIDGALGARGAVMLEPYSDEPDAHGVVRVTPENLRAILRQSLANGFTAAMHAIGDGGNRIVLDAVEDVLEENPVEDHRMRVEHAQIVALEDIPRFAELGLIASFQWIHATLDMPWAEDRVGSERIQGGYAWRTFLDQGIRIVGSSDEGARTFSPFMGMHAAVTRQDSDGNPAGGWYPEQRLTRLEALRSYTLDAAYASFEEDVLGSITPGKYADLTVLSKDIMTIPASEILDTQAVMTMVGGEIVFQRTGSPWASSEAGDAAGGR
jgi:predicted amidohydrolase YtcJ